MKNNLAQKGSALLITILLMNLILFLSIYFLNFSLTEQKISNSQIEGAKTYYLAEAGIAEMVNRLKNDTTFKNNFETNPTWVETITRNEPFGPGSGSYEVTITNSDLAHGEIVSTGIIDIGSGKTTQRIVKTYVYRALGSGGVTVGENCGYADGNIDISFSYVNFFGGSAHSNNTFNINSLSIVNVEKNLNAVGNLNLNWSAQLNVGSSTYAANYPPAASPVTMPAVDFDSDDANSFKNRADVIYTEDDFEDLMWNNQNLTLNDDIVYVEGDVEMRGAQKITLDGLLVIDDDLIVGKHFFWGFRFGHNSIIVNHTSGKPSGILVKGKIYFKTFTGDIDVDGVIYANDQLTVSSFPLGYSFDVVGAMIARKLSLTSVWQAINITRDEDILNETIGSTTFSPVITVEHWEEEY